MYRRSRRRKREKDPFPASREKNHHSPVLKVSMTPASARFSRVSSSRTVDARTAGRAANPSRYREAVFYPSVLARTDARRARVAFSPPGLVLSINSQNLEFSFSVRAKETRARFDGHARLENTLRTRSSDSPQEKYFSNGAPLFFPALVRSLAADFSARESFVIVLQYSKAGVFSSRNG